MDVFLTGTGARVIEIKVYGMPGPQGSKSFKGIHGGHAVMKESSAKVKPWRHDVKAAAVAAMGGAGRGIQGPVVADMVFTLPKPKSAPKRRRTWPDRKPDLSKLARSTEDALSEVGAWEDDARVIEYGRLAKVFPGEDPDALPVPGAVIRLRSVPA